MHGSIHPLVRQHSHTWIRIGPDRAYLLHFTRPQLLLLLLQCCRCFVFAKWWEDGMESVPFCFLGPILWNYQISAFNFLITFLSINRHPNNQLGCITCNSIARQFGLRCMHMACDVYKYLGWYYRMARDAVENTWDGITSWLAMLLKMYVLHFLAIIQNP